MLGLARRAPHWSKRLWQRTPIHCAAVGGYRQLPRRTGSFGTSSSVEQSNENEPLLQKAVSQNADGERGVRVTWSDNSTSFFHAQWLWHNSEQYIDPGTGQKLLSPHAVPSNPNLLVAAKHCPRNDSSVACTVDAHLHKQGPREPVLELKWIGGEKTSVPVHFLAYHDYSLASMQRRVAAAEALDVHVAVDGSAVTNATPKASFETPDSAKVLEISFEENAEESAACSRTGKGIEARTDGQRANVDYVKIVQDSLHPPNTSLPEVDYADIMSDDESGQKNIWRWLMGINTHGMAIVRNVPTVNEEVSRVASLISEVQKSIYGYVFDVKAVPNPINVAYSNRALDLHHDLAYYESPPGIQLLHCLRFDKEVTGGNSTFMDAHRVAYRLYELDPEAFFVLATVPATFQKIHYAREHPTHMVYKRPHISLSHYPLLLNPALKNSASSQHLPWASAASNSRPAVSGVFWAPPFEGPLTVPPQWVEPYYDAYTKFARLLREMESEALVERRLNPGDLVAFNNRRMLHGRREFSHESAEAGGERHIQGCYVNIDEFKSRLSYLCHSKFGFEDPFTVGSDSSEHSAASVDEYKKHISAVRMSSRTIRGVGNQCHL
eukprot:gb/GECG01004020.1/.p1 GENE.gb/GECG01004020.1/~~gb/GECG01004020.1/.p1  ORF type:complete len:608 (+),score=63.57 gb/GECG01004020.1/:1-1824(+)